MPDREILSEKPLTLVGVNEVLERIEKREKELNFRANKVKDYLDIFVKKEDVEKIKKLHEQLTNAQISRLKEKQIVKILDVMPKDIDELKSVLATEDATTLRQEDLQKILEIIQK